MIDGLLMLLVGLVTGVAVTVVRYETQSVEYNPSDGEGVSIEDVGFGHIPQSVKATVAETPDIDPRGRVYKVVPSTNNPDRDARVIAIDDNPYHE